MKAKRAYLVKERTLEIRIDDICPGDNQILVKVKLCGLCNWELHFYKGIGGDFYTDYPKVIGHEWAGVVVEKGKNVKNFEIGDKVTFLPGNFQGFAEYTAVDGVIICVANKYHCEMTVQAFEHKKHVLCEKPIAVTLDEADKMIEASKKAGKYLMIAQSQRYDGAHLKTKEILSSGILGKILTFETCFFTGDPDTWSVDKGSGTWFLNKQQAGLGAMGDLGIHKADLMRYFLGEEIKYATAFVGTLHKKGPDGQLIGIDDNGMCILESESGIRGVLRASWTTYGKGWTRTTLYCENGVLEVDNDEEDQIKIYFKNGETKTIHVDVDDSLMAATFAECIETNTPPEIDGVEGKKALNIVLKCLESSKLNSRVEV